MMKLNFALISLLSFASPIFAANSYFCAGTSNYAVIGNTMAQVLANCGQPKTVTQNTTPSSQPTQVTQWVYNYQNNSQLRKLNTPNYQLAALIVNMVNNKVVSILVNGQNVSSTNFCGANIKLNVGDSNLKVRQICNAPSQIQQVTQDIAQPSITTVNWTYQSEFQAPVTMTFQDGILQSIQ